MRALIDILTPKQCLFFGKLSERLEAQGHQVLRTTRQYREVEGLLRLKGLEATVVGKHGGASLSEKLRASAERVLALASLFENFKPDAVFSFSSPEAARVAFGLGTPHLCVNDSPHAEAVARLTVPISKRLFTPKVVGRRAWTRFGINADAVVEYNALDPAAWLRGFKPDPAVPERLGLDRALPIVVLRPEEAFAAYLLGKTKPRSIIEALVERLLEAEPDVQLVVMPRYAEQVEAFKAYRSARLTVAESVLDGTSLLSYSSIFVGAGGTMTAEACLLGVPTLSCYPGEPYLVERFLLRKGLLKRASNVEEALRYVQSVLGDLKLAQTVQRRRAQGLLARMEDPIEVISQGLKVVEQR
ncbi:MAG: DUF354 domain-containing protein [Candidatus Bathyarchaeia archaeon]